MTAAEPRTAPPASEGPRTAEKPLLCADGPETAPAATFCPHCGYDLRKDILIERDGWSFDPRGVAFYSDKPVRLTPGEFSILHSLAKADGRIVSVDALLGRIGSDGSLQTTVYHVRQHLGELKIPDPIENVFARGYRWRTCS